MSTGALFTFQQGYTATAATGSGSSGFQIFIRDHTRQLDFRLQVLACGMQPADLRSEQALGVTTLNQPLPKECLKLQCWKGAQTNLSQFSLPYLSGGNAISLHLSDIFCRVILRARSSPLSLDTAYHPVGDHLLQRYLLKLV